MTLKISNTNRISIFHTPKVCGFMFYNYFCLKLLLPSMIIFKKHKIIIKKGQIQMNDNIEFGNDGF